MEEGDLGNNFLKEFYAVCLQRVMKDECGRPPEVLKCHSRRFGLYSLRMRVRGRFEVENVTIILFLLIFLSWVVKSKTASRKTISIV